MHIKNYKQLLIDTLQREYKIYDVASVINSKEGFLSDGFIVHASDKKYYLKSFRKRLRKSLDFTAKGSLYFSENGIPAIIPIQTTRGEYYFEFNEIKYALFPFIADINVKSWLNNHDLKIAGQLLGKIHLVGRDCPFTDPDRMTKSMTKEFTEKRIKKVMDVIEKKKNLDKIDNKFIKMINLRKKLIKKYEFNLEKYGLKSDHLIHGDYHRRNISFDNNGEINHVFDFKCLTSSRFYELTRSLRIICFDAKNPFSEENLEKARHYLMGYNSIYPFTKSEFKNGLICHFSENFHSLWKEEEYYLRNNKTVLKLFDNSMEMLTYVSQHFNETVEKITDLV